MENLEKRAYFNIRQGSRSSICKRFYTNTDFFKDEVILKLTNEYISFEKPTIDYGGNLVKFTKVKSTQSSYEANLNDKDFKLPLGKFHFDEEESNEDFLILYFDEL